MARFKAAKGLNVTVAKLIVPDITEIAETAANGARVVAPAEKVWTSVGDALVRPTHRKANGQAVPANLRYTLDVPEYDQEHGQPPREMARHPRDRSLSDGNYYECRCFEKSVPDGVSKTIRAHRAVATGPRTAARVTCDHELAEPAEFGNSEDQGARFMAAGIRHAAQRLG